MRSNSFETQQVREIGRREGESKGFHILWIEIIKTVRWKETNAKTRKD